jgi:FkbM family methyltransferase
MIESIKHIPNDRIININYFKNSKLPLLLYGTGIYASWVKRFLDDENIKIDYVVVDKAFYNPNIFFYDFPVKIIDNVINEQPKVNIILGSSKLKEKIGYFSSCEKVSKITFFDISLFTGFDKEFIEANFTVFKELYYRLEDDLSKEILVTFIKSKQSLCSDELCKLNVEDEPAYFPSFLHLNRNGVFVDCGAYDGDTTIMFNKLMLNKYGVGGGIYAFECDRLNVEKFKKNTVHLKNIRIIEKGCWSEKKQLSFFSEGTMNSKIIENGEFQIEVDSIDNIVQDEISYIKMDIEGAELEALKGARNTILKYKPQLAVSVYHKQEDLITIPQYILSLNQNYKLFLRHYGDISVDTVLYAI